MFFAHKKYSHKTEPSEYFSNSSRKRSKLNATISDTYSEEFYQSIPSDNLHKNQERSKIIFQLNNISTMKNPWHKFGQQKKIDSQQTLRNHRKNSAKNTNSMKINYDIQSKMSTQPQGNIYSYGISTFKGINNVQNSHHIGIHLGILKNFMLVESFEGSLAGKFLKQIYPLQLIDITTKNIQNPQKSIESNVTQAFIKTQQKLMKQQSDLKNNSGAFLASVIITQNQIKVANCGISQVLCENKVGEIIKLNKIHNTKNPEQVERLKINNIQLYQQIIQNPFESIRQTDNLLRIAPSGLTCTKVLGRNFDYRKQQHSENSSRALSWQPQIVSITTSDIKWVGIFSESVWQNCTSKFISQIIRGQLKKKSSSYTQHHISMECSHKIVSHAIKKNCYQSCSALIILLGLISEKINREEKIVYFKNRKSQLKRQIPNVEDERPKSLQYIGTRKSFIKSHERFRNGVSSEASDRSKSIKQSRRKKLFD